MRDDENAGAAGPLGPTGKSVLVTGGTGGIGRSLVDRFARAGDRVWFTDPVRVQEIEVPGAAVPPQGSSWT